MIFSEKLGIAIKIKGGGYVPKSGLLFVEELQKLTVSGRILDIGTGETGILANCLLAMGASGVVATDIDPEAIQWAQNASNISSAIMWEHCNLYPETARENRFDMIVSNPPQMPSLNINSLHDYGGLDGREIILKILYGAGNYLSMSGRIIILCFDFLGIDRRTNDHPSIQEIGNILGYKFKILRREVREVRKGGETEKNIGWIEKIYPRYKFIKNNCDNSIHNLLVIELQKRR